jgi:hypothetical protein
MRSPREFGGPAAGPAPVANGFARRTDGRGDIESRRESKQELRELSPAEFLKCVELFAPPLGGRGQAASCQHRCSGAFEHTEHATISMNVILDTDKSNPLLLSGEAWAPWSANRMATSLTLKLGGLGEQSSSGLAIQHLELQHIKIKTKT